MLSVEAQDKTNVNKDDTFIYVYTLDAGYQTIFLTLNYVKICLLVKLLS